MNTSKHRISETDLHAYLDGQLDPDRIPEVEAYLNAHPEAAHKINRFRAMNQELQELFDPILDEAVPERLQPSQQAAHSDQPRYPRVLAQAASVAALMLVSGLTGWWLRDASLNHNNVLADHQPPAMIIEQALVQPALVSHRVYTPEVVHPVEVTRDRQQHLAQWLSKRLDTPLQIPDLSELGFELVGGRLLPGSITPAAQFMYENTSGLRLTLYIRHKPGQAPQTAFRHRFDEGIGTFYWIDGNLGYALSAELDKATLWDAANRVYRQLNF